MNNNNLSKFFSSIILVATGFYGLWLQISGNLLLYINPRYEIISIFASIVCLMIGLVNLYYLKSEVRKFSIKQFLSFPKVLIIYICIILFVPPASLSTSSFSLNSAQLNSFTGTTQKTSLEIFSSVSSNYEIAEWVSLLNTSEDISSFDNLEVNLSGFIKIENNVAFISRYVISCCVLDATPVGIPIVIDTKKYEDGEWISVSGNLKLDSTKKLGVIIEPSEIEIIQEPNNPYAN